MKNIPEITLLSESTGEMPRRTFRIAGDPEDTAWRESWIKNGRKPCYCEITIYGDIHGQASLCSYGGEVWPMAWPSLFRVPVEKTCNNVGTIYVNEHLAISLNTIIDSQPLPVVS